MKKVEKSICGSRHFRNFRNIEKRKKTIEEDKMAYRKY